MSEVAFLIIVLTAYILPVVIILNSKRTQGHEKNAWLVGTLFFSWLALAMYLTIIPKHGRKKKPKHSAKR